VKVICTCIPAIGRFNVVAPLAHSLQAAGHSVIFVTSSDFEPHIRNSGFDTIIGGLGIALMREAVMNRMEISAGLAHDKMAWEMFTNIAPRALCYSAIARARSIDPDLLLHEEGEFGGALIAALLGIPSVAVGWPSPMRAPALLRELDTQLAALWLEFGKRARSVGGLFSHLYLDTCPPSLQGLHALEVERRMPLRPAQVESPKNHDSPLVNWLQDSHLPTVHATFGTVLPFESVRELIDSIITGLAPEPIRLILTVDAEGSALKNVNTRVRIEHFVPHGVLMPACDVVICHGGAGSTIAALSHGLPLLIVPLGGASQHRMAAACTRLGAAKVIELANINASSFRNHVKMLLSQPSYRIAAQQIAKEINAMPHPSAMLPVIEELVRSSKIEPQRRG
jgi:UDP:flavonoid glycosyltransferase YjiC (YdhE family)